jgi:hypothetical protein
MKRISKISGMIVLFVLLYPDPALSQQTIIKGIVTDSVGRSIGSVSITVHPISSGTITDQKGRYSLKLPSGESEYTLIFSYLGFKTKQFNIKCDEPKKLINVTLYEDIKRIREITVRAGRNETGDALAIIPFKDIRLLPSPSGNFETALKTMPGVASNNELSSQYSVRGGNYDENLVYVNDIEIFRPFLIRSGQQEGLSFINSDLVSSVKFSSGGFSAIYGDKMSSVLDITYKSPVSNKGSVSLGLLTSSAHYEGISRNKKLSYILGIRYKSSRLMLKTLDSKGNYQPVFADIQSLINYRTGNRSGFSFLSAFSSNTYNFIPQSRESSFGNEAETYRLYVLFAGREKDRYRTWNTNLTWEISEKSKFSHKIILSALNSIEKESFDIRGWYSLNSLDKNLGSDNISDSLMNIGIGSWLSHARNNLSAGIYSLSYKAEKHWNKNSLLWGVKLRNDNFNDRLKEWTKVDSAEYSLPSDSESLLVTNLIGSENSLQNWLIDSYLHSANHYIIGYKKVAINAGLRSYYDSFSQEFLMSPRTYVSVEAWKNLSIHLSGGLYYQPPFYREMRYPDGSLNTQIKSQKSIHTVIGFNYYFTAWDRPFIFTTELYNKILSNIIPYRIDNVRIIYSGRNLAEGYSRGIDMHVNGEFVPGAESWISLSVMDSKLKIPSEGNGKFPSPSDQTVNLNIFFQDYLPGYPTWRAHINISYVTGIPVSSPYNDRYDQYHRLPSYRRVDLGITKVIKGPKSALNGNKFLKYFDELIAGAEIFNLLDINNTISYLWIKTVNNMSGETRQFAVPNYLTGRSLNLKVAATF